MADDRHFDEGSGSGEAEEHDDLLWRAAAVHREVAGAGEEASEAGDARWSDDDLAAYRAGRLDADRHDRLEADLIDSPALRARLARRGGVETGGAVDAAARARALEAFDAASSEPRGRVLAWRPRSVRSWTVATAVAALAALLTLAVVWTREPPGMPSDLIFHVEARGLAEVRGDERASGGDEPAVDRDGLPRVDPVVAAPDTRVVLEVSPSRSVAGVTFALYRRPASAARPTPVALPSSALTVERGAARIEAPARALLGDVPGEGVLYVVARPGGDGDAPPGDAPPDRTVDDFVADVSADRIRVVVVPYSLLPSAPR